MNYDFGQKVVYRNSICLYLKKEDSEYSWIIREGVISADLVLTKEISEI